MQEVLTHTRTQHGSAVGAAIELRDLTKRYGGFTAVAGVTLDVQPGEVFGLLDPTAPARPRRSR